MTTLLLFIACLLLLIAFFQQHLASAESRAKAVFWENSSNRRWNFLRTTWRERDEAKQEISELAGRLAAERRERDKLQRQRDYWEKCFDEMLGLWSKKCAERVAVPSPRFLAAAKKLDYVLYGDAGEWQGTDNLAKRGLLTAARQFHSALKDLA